MTNALAAAKLATTFAVGSCASAVTHNLIQATLTEPETTVEAVKLGVGASVIGFMVADAASSYTDALIDTVASVFKRKGPLVASDEPIIDVNPL